MRMEGRKPGKNDPPNRPHDPDPKHLRQPRDGSDPSVKQKSSKRTNANRQQSSRHGHPGQLQSSNQRKIKAPSPRRPNAFQPRPEKSGILRKPNRSRSNRKRRAERKLPDKQKRNEPSQLARPINFFQISIRPARPWHSRAQLRPNQPIADGQKRAQHPTQHRLRP